MTPRFNKFPLLQASQIFGDSLAYLDGKRRVTYQQLQAMVQIQADALLNKNVRPGDPIAWVPESDFETLLRFWSLWSVGAIACPISHRFPDNTRSQIVARLSARQWDDLDMAPPSQPQKGLHSGCREWHSTVPFEPTAPATIILSSGTSGEPKAVVHDLYAHLANAAGANQRIPLTEGDRWLWALPKFHVGGLAVIFRCTLGGACLCGVESGGSSLLQQIELTRCSHVSLVPTQLQRLLSDDADLTKLKAILLGGTMIPTTLTQKMVQQRVPIHTTYGLTEMASQVCTTERLGASCSHVGTVLPFREVRISEDEEILVRGPTLCKGYWKDGQVQNPCDDHGWFHTKDRGFLNSQNELTVLGRIDNMFISGGENIHPEAIERCLLDINGVCQATVVPVEDAEFGMRPVAFVEADEFQPSVWSRQLSDQLAKFEIPVAYYPWPQDAMLAIKPDRTKLADLARGRDRSNY